MKPITIIACLLLVALSLFAVGPQSQTKDDPTTQATTHTETVLSTAQAVGVGDSPLVRAAKASRRPGKKSSSTVITNDTLVRTGGHFTTTTLEAQKPLPIVRTGGKSMDQLAADARKKKADAAATAATATKLEELKKDAAARTQSSAESDTPEALSEEAPAIEDLQPLKPMTPPTTAQKPKPPL